MSHHRARDEVTLSFRELEDLRAEGNAETVHACSDVEVDEVLEAVDIDAPLLVERRDEDGDDSLDRWTLHARHAPGLQVAGSTRLSSM